MLGVHQSELLDLNPSPWATSLGGLSLRSRCWGHGWGLWVLPSPRQHQKQEVPWWVSSVFFWKSFQEAQSKTRPISPCNNL